MMTMDIVSDIAERLGWRTCFETQTNWRGQIETYAEFSQYSPAGEDFSFIVFYDKLTDIGREVMRYSYDFDIEEHVLMWLEAKRNGDSTVPDVVTLVDDARAIEKMIEDLADELIKGD